MDAPSEEIRDLARRLIELESSAEPGLNGTARSAVRVSDKLRIVLIRFAGADGFTALLRRAVALARRETNVPEDLKITPDGRLEESGGSPASTPGRPQRGPAAAPKSEGADQDDAAAAITAHLLWLLVTFIGETLTMQLAREAWPEMDDNDTTGAAGAED